MAAGDFGYQATPTPPPVPKQSWEQTHLPGYDPFFALNPSISQGHDDNTRNQNIRYLSYLLQYGHQTGDWSAADSLVKAGKAQGNAIPESFISEADAVGSQRQNQFDASQNPSFGSRFSQALQNPGTWALNPMLAPFVAATQASSPEGQLAVQSTPLLGTFSQVGEQFQDPLIPQATGVNDPTQVAPGAKAAGSVSAGINNDVAAVQRAIGASAPDVAARTLGGASPQFLARYAAEQAGRPEFDALGLVQQYLAGVR